MAEVSFSAVVLISTSQVNMGYVNHRGLSQSWSGLRLPETALNQKRDGHIR